MIPTPPEAQFRESGIAAGYQHVCAIDSRGGGQTWGLGAAVGSTPWIDPNWPYGFPFAYSNNIPSPQAIPTTGLTQVAAAGLHTIALTTASTIVGWAYGSNPAAGATFASP